MPRMTPMRANIVGPPNSANQHHSRGGRDSPLSTIIPFGSIRVFSEGHLIGDRRDGELSGGRALSGEFLADEWVSWHGHHHSGGFGPGQAVLWGWVISLS
jgi:hypothetical protein